MEVVKIASQLLSLLDIVDSKTKSIDTNELRIICQAVLDARDIIRSHHHDCIGDQNCFSDWLSRYSQPDEGVEGR